MFELADVIEKPDVHEAPSRRRLVPRYVFSPAIFEHLHVTKPGKKGEIQLTDAMRAAEGGEGSWTAAGGGERRFDIGNFESYFQTFVEFALSDEEYGPSLAKHVRKLLDASEKGRR